MSKARAPVSVVSLKLRLGEVALGEFGRRLVVHSDSPYLGGPSFESVESAMRDLPDEAQGVLLRSIRVEESLPKLSLGRDCIRYVPRQYERYFVDLSTSYDVYLDTFSGKSRAGLRRKVRKFEKESGGSIRWQCYKTPSECEEFYRLAREISVRSYQERLLNAGLPDDDAFKADMLEDARHGNVRAYLIFFRNEAVAYLYCPVRTGIVIYSYLGFRSEFADLSPGTVLLWLVMEDLFREGGFRAFDFTEGGDRAKHSQKRLFATSSMHCVDVYGLKWSASNVAVTVTHAAVDWFSSMLGITLAKVGLKQVVRAWMRKRSGAL